MPSSRVLFLPLSRRGQGTGHLRRCYQTASTLKIPGILLIDDTDPDVLLPSDWKDVIPGFPGSLSVLLTSDALQSDSFPKSSGTLALFDRRRSRRDHLLPWAGFSTPVLLDDNGSARDCAPFVLDTIPGPRGSDANEASPLYLNLPPRRRDPDPSGPVLVSFGGEDPAGITLPFLELLLGAGMKAERIHLTLPAGLRGKTLPGKAGELKILEAPENLREHLGNYGLVFCSYGLTLWEAAAAGCAVISVDPSPYHARLSAEAGFPGLGYMNAASSGSIRKTGKKLRNLLNSPEELRESAGRISARLEGHSEITLAGLLESLDSPEPRCTACGRILPRVISRFPRRSYYRCSDCGIIGLYRFTPPPENEYGSSYFQQEYEKQYGKSYLDDFQSIRTMGFSRLRLISRRGKKGGNLLDIGCAFGPFLHAAREAGYRCRGIDISEEAVAYVRDKLGIPAISGAFPGEDPSGRLKEAFGTGEFDIITLWYVIEHFQDLKRVLEALNSLLPVKGVLAMSTPNAAGISGRRSLRTFLEKSPEDHYSVWSPRTARKILSRYGFRVYRIRVTGHHPERFSALHRSTGEDPGRDGDASRRSAAALGSVRMKFLGLVSRIFSLGDTFEIYAVKERFLV